jgi:hypothetical protein
VAMLLNSETFSAQHGLKVIGLQGENKQEMESCNEDPEM